MTTMLSPLPQPHEEARSAERSRRRADAPSRSSGQDRRDADRSRRDAATRDRDDFAKRVDQRESRKADGAQRARPEGKGQAETEAETDTAGPTAAETGEQSEVATELAAVVLEGIAQLLQADPQRSGQAEAALLPAELTELSDLPLLPQPTDETPQATGTATTADAEQALLATASQQSGLASEQTDGHAKPVLTSLVPSLQTQERSGNKDSAAHTGMLPTGEAEDGALSKLPFAPVAAAGGQNLDQQATQYGPQNQPQQLPEEAVATETAKPGFELHGLSGSQDSGPTAVSSLNGSTPISPQVSPASAPAQAPAEQANPVDTMIAKQVSRALVQELPGGERVLQLRLTPPELGTVRVEIIEHQGRISIKLGAEDDGVRQSLERALPLLRQELRQSDAPISQLQMSDAYWFDQQGRERQTGQEQRGSRRRPGQGFSLEGVEAAPPETAHPTTTALGGQISDSGVNARA